MTMGNVSPTKRFLVTFLLITLSCEGIGKSMPSSLKKETKCAVFVPDARTIVQKNPVAASLGAKTIDSLQTEVCRDGSCDISLCFALDGSGSISAEEYQVQKDLVKLIAILAAPANATFSAVQYGLANEFISVSTSDPFAFMKYVDNSVLLRAPRTFLTAGLGFCISQVNENPKAGGKKVVVLGDGRDNYMESSLALVLKSAESVDIFAVGIGNSLDTQKLLEITGGQKNHVYTASNYADVGQVVVDLVRALCSVPEAVEG
ncbi:unnamed protein product [Chondrus crispus]|uniref:VWFA domain-containing protein n=1 Tax=Chondrus crispus TaxID=2769 RepID=R7Q5C2_CHOCR|nr:unnamed protein product [Chondrus crispus]CDF33028.1 unnamed protein product [Chondrus crispus]|eukprot:XP_005712831.1 unnamed protein product [Chondrus crispus]